MTQERRLDDKEELPLLAWTDAALALSEAGHFLLARLLQPAAADRLADRLAAMATGLRPQKRQHVAARYQGLLGHRAAEMPSPDVYARALIATFLRQRALYARLAATPGWRPPLVVEGADAVEEALREGRGVVLWIVPQEMTPMLVRMVCHDAGWRLHHMSHWQHGQSDSRLGITVFNRRDCRIEDRLAGRLTLRGDDTTTALAEADRLLAAGEIVSFRGIGWAQRPVYYPLFAGHMHLGLGAPVTARRAGAALFSTMAIPENDGFRVTFRPLANAKGRSFEEVGQEFAARIEQAFSAAPFLWNVISDQWVPGAPPVPFGKRLRV